MNKNSLIRKILLVIIVASLMITPINSVSAWTKYNYELIEIDPCVDEIYPLAEGMYRFKSIDGLYGYMDEQYKIVIEPHYTHAKDFAQSAAIVSLEDKYGLIDKSGQILIPCEYYSISDFNDKGVARVETTSFVGGFVNTKGEFLTELNFPHLSDFYNGVAYYLLDNNFNNKVFLDENLNEIIFKNEYEYITWEPDGEAFIVELNQKYGIVSKDDTEIVPCIYDYIGSCINGFYEVQQNGKWGMININGKVIVPCIYNDMYFLGNDFYRVKENGKYGIIDINGKIIAPCIYDTIYPFYDNLLTIAVLNGAAKIINRSGEILYEDYQIGKYNHDTAQVLENGQPIKVVDLKTGEESAYSDIVVLGDYNNGVALAMHYNSPYYGLVDEAGNIIRDFDIPTCSLSFYRGHAWEDYYTYPYTISEGMIAVLIDEKWGYMDLSGNMVIQPQFDKLYRPSDSSFLTGHHISILEVGAGNFIHGFAKVTLNGQRFSIDKQGNLYDNLDIVCGADFYDYPSEPVDNSKMLPLRVNPPFPIYKYNYNEFNDHYLFLQDDYAALANGSYEILLESDGTALKDHYGNIIVENCIMEPYQNDETKQHLAVSFNADKTLLIKTVDKKYVLKVTEYVADNQLILTIGSYDASVNGQTVSIDAAPKIVNDRTMLPARFVAENLGASVAWDATAPGTVTITKDSTEIIIKIGEPFATVNGEQIPLDAPAFIEHDRTYTPIRFLSEKLGGHAEWIAETQQAIITYK